MNSFGTGAGGAAPLWNAFMRAALSGVSVESFPKPDPVFSSKPMLDGSPVSSTFPEPHTILHVVDTDNPQGPFPGNPGSDNQYSNWEWSVRRRAGL